MNNKILMSLFVLIFIAGCNGPVHSVRVHDAGAVPPPHHEKAAPPAHPAPTKALDLTALPDIAGIIPKLAALRVVFVGETHDRLDHHLNQLAIIRGLYAKHPDLAIGMEYFQQPFQRYLDDYVAGKLSEQEMLKKTEYYKRWRYDYRLYAPILRFARKHGIPLVALNLPMEITRKVGRHGLASLTAAEKKQIPQEIDRSDAAYRARLKAIYGQHPHGDVSDFEHFYEGQLLWDTGMAERAAHYLRQHPHRRMVVLAGSGHLQYGSGIPHRLTRRIKVTSAIVLNNWYGPIKPEAADYILLSKKQQLPPPGRLGIVLEPAHGELRIASLAGGSAAEAAGIEKGDRLLSLNGAPITDMADVKLVMWDKRPGDKVSVKVRRKFWLEPDKDLGFDVVLR